MGLTLVGATTHIRCVPLAEEGKKNHGRGVVSSCERETKVVGAYMSSSSMSRCYWCVVKSNDSDFFD